MWEITTCRCNREQNYSPPGSDGLLLPNKLHPHVVSLGQNLLLYILILWVRHVDRAGQKMLITVHMVYDLAGRTRSWKRGDGCSASPSPSYSSPAFHIFTGLA